MMHEGFDYDGYIPTFRTGKTRRNEGFQGPTRKAGRGELPRAWQRFWTHINTSSCFSAKLYKYAKDRLDTLRSASVTTFSVATPLDQLRQPCQNRHREPGQYWTLMKIFEAHRSSAIVNLTISCLSRFRKDHSIHGRWGSPSNLVQDLWRSCLLEIRPSRGHPWRYVVTLAIGFHSNLSPPGIRRLSNAFFQGPGMAHDYLTPIGDLQTSRPVVFYDQLCSNRSTHLPNKPKSFWTIDLFVDELVNLTNHLGISSRFDILGHSWGGILASEFVIRRQPSGLRKLVLVGSLASMEL